MTTFTLQDLTDNTNQVEISSTNDTIIQGATGAQYTPMDTSPQAQQNQKAIEQLLNNLTYTIQAIIKLSVEKYKQPVSEGLSEAVGTVLEQTQWFKDRVEERVAELVEDNDFSYEVERAVENWFDNFSLEDHVDVYSMVDTAVDERISDVVGDALESVLEEKLTELLQGKNISISFN